MSAPVDKDHVPPTHQDRRQVWLEAVRVLEGVPRERPLTREALASLSERVVSAAGLGAEGLGYAMVMVNNAFWFGQFAAIPRERRLLLLPRCMRELDNVIAQADRLGYRHIVADGSPIVVKILTEESMDGVLGLGCLDSLDKAFDKARQIGIPSLAVPLNTNGCKETDIDTDMVLEFMNSAGSAAGVKTRSHLPLLRRASAVFSRESIADLLPEVADGTDRTAEIAIAWLTTGGKRLRPFLALAGYDAFAGGGAPPAFVRKFALAIEAFHKASLAHDDIEDDDATRYGRPTLDRQYGTAIALNVGDYLVGLGYRLASSAAQESGVASASALVGMLSDAHIKLSLGQGAEFLWARDGAHDLKLDDVLKWYMLKTAPAFEIALAGGLVLAGALDGREEPVARFCRQMGTAFQLQNDLDGWKADAEHLRPTALLALTCASCSEEERAALFASRDAAAIREAMTRHRVFDRIQDVIDRLRTRSLGIAEECGGPLGELMSFLVDAVIR
jgi:geranylgeranyl pyrophosphate synthase